MVECVPNISEGRRLPLLVSIAAAVEAVPGVRLLDWSADPDHNRSVFTFVGEPSPLRQAVLAIYERVMPAIDLRTHRGAHPRIGAVDVVPFVPLAGATIEECVDLARTTGAAIAHRFEVPVFLYEAAATLPARRNLAAIREGGSEGLAARMAEREWVPDFGPAALHPTAGASAVGARGILVAFNVNLAGGRLEDARAIAAAVRERNGGLPAVKAVGLRLPSRNLMQVSMNLTDYWRTNMAEAFAAVAREAAKRGIEVQESELIGLAPVAAFGGVAPDAIRMTNFRPDCVLEERLGSLP